MRKPTRWYQRLIWFVPLGLLLNVPTVALIAILGLRYGQPNMLQANRPLESGDVWQVSVSTALGYELISSVTTRQMQSVVAAARGPQWETRQATGPPDTFTYGDVQTAWASLTPDDQPEWLVLEFEPPVLSETILVYETYNPGAITSVSICGEEDGYDEQVVWTGNALRAAPPRIHIADFALSHPQLVSRVRLALDSRSVPSWNEIDAVGLADDRGELHWATGAAASSTYADMGYVNLRTRAAANTSPDPRTLIPDWASRALFDNPPALASIAPTISQSQRNVMAYGWPALACFAVSDAQNPFAGTVTFGRVFQEWPTHFLWRGLAVNALVYTALAYFVAFVFATPFRFWTELNRVRRGHCPHCGYDLRFRIADGCPECGFLRESPTEETRAKKRNTRR